MPARSAGGGARAPMVTGGGHRHGGAAAERGEGKGEKRRRSVAHPRSTVTTKKAAGAEEGGGAARVDGDGGAPAVGELDEGVNGDGDGAAKPKEATPGRETVRGDDGGGPELDGGEAEGNLAASMPEVVVVRPTAHGWRKGRPGKFRRGGWRGRCGTAVFPLNTSNAVAWPGKRTSFRCRERQRRRKLTLWQSGTGGWRWYSGGNATVHQ
uniref:Pr1-like protein n=1 Tax=Oryza sativa subsp. indica TaxID=39946 RepID=C8TFA9_ORYSI|nr:pr1-like protein [Oryza sativa Indica Group]BAI39962.1 pr1-like protein [Oryza sativa Indica Group]